MKNSFIIGLVEVESCMISKIVCVTTFFGHHSVLSPICDIIRELIYYGVFPFISPIIYCCDISPPNYVVFFILGLSSLFMYSFMIFIKHCSFCTLVLFSQCSIKVVYII
jgi:hypothetical protein